MVISSRTPDGRPNRCPVCGADFVIEPSDPAGEAPCPACGHLVWFDFHERGDEQVIRLTANRLLPEELDAAPETAALSGASRLVIDFADVQDISSAALARLINLKRHVGVLKRKLAIRHLGATLIDVFRVTRLDKVFDIEA